MLPGGILKLQFDRYIRLRVKFELDFELDFELPVILSDRGIRDLPVNFDLKVYEQHWMSSNSSIIRALSLH